MSTTPTKKPATLVAVSDATLPATVREWKEISAWMETAKKTEKELREKIAAALFPSPVEGVNRVQAVLDGQTVEIALDHKINRKLDEPGLDAVMLQLPENSPYRQAGVLIAYKPSLVLKGFRTMPDEQRRIFSQCLTETPGLPSLEVEVIEDPRGTYDLIRTGVGEYRVGEKVEEAAADWPAKVEARENRMAPAITIEIPAHSIDAKAFKQKLAKTMSGFIGKKNTPDTRKKISAATKAVKAV